MQTIDVRVLELTYEADRVVSVRLGRVDGLPLPPWEPGAHVDLVLPTAVVRQYSIVEAGPAREWYRVAVLLDRLSRGGSEYVHLFLRAGQRLQIHEPRNHFVLRDASRYLFIAGGIGITPLLPMIEAVEGRSRPWSLCYTGRSLESMAFRRRLEEHGRRVTLWPSRERGRLPLDDVLPSRGDDLLVYACGPAGLVDAVSAGLVERGWSPNDVVFERFKPTPRVTGPDRAFLVRAARSGKDVTVGEGESVLAALVRDGIPIDYSCENGVCGTCEVRVLDGTPDHRDDVLSAAQQEAGDTMLVCVSRACTDTLVLEV